MNLSLRRSNKEIPHVPFYKDERILGKQVTVSVYLRVLIVALSVFVITVGYVFFVLFAYLNSAHANRLKDQAHTDRKIQQLACVEVHGLPDSSSDTVKAIRAQYHCPNAVKGKPAAPGKGHLSKPSSVLPKISPSSVHAAGPGVSQSTTIPTRSQTIVVTKSGPKPKAKPTNHAPAARTSSTPSSTSPSKATPPILTIPGPNKTCQLGVLGICVAG